MKYVCINKWVWNDESGLRVDVGEIIEIKYVNDKRVFPVGFIPAIPLEEFNLCFKEAL